MKTIQVKRRATRALQMQQLEKRELFAADSGLGGSVPDGSDPSQPGLYATPPGSAVPAPFWRKIDGVPSAAPAWYQNIGPVTRDVFYNPSLTPAQNGAALKTVLTTLPAGSRVVIHAGTYSVDSYFVITAQGTASKPVVIEGAPGEKVSITRKDGLQNVINVNNSSYLLMRNLDVYGGSCGIKLYSVSDVMVYNTKVHHTGDAGITANANNTSRLYIVDNEISYTSGLGEAIYLGSHDGLYKSNNSYIVGNYIHHLANGTSAQGDGIEIKDGSYANVVKYNFIEGTKYPGITVYRTGRGAADRNVIEENVVINSVDAGIQVTADAVVRNNLVIGKSTAFTSKPFTTNPVNMVVSNNTFLGAGPTVRLTNWLTTDLAFANNAIHSSVGQFYTSGGTGRAVATGNVNVTNLATTFTNLKLDGSALNARPIAGSTVIGKASSNYLPVGDLNGDTRITKMDSGAVDFTGDSTTVARMQSSSGTNKLASPLVSAPSNQSGTGQLPSAQPSGNTTWSSTPAALTSSQNYAIRRVSTTPAALPASVASAPDTHSAAIEQSELQRASLLEQLVSQLQVSVR